MTEYSQNEVEAIECSKEKVETREYSQKEMEEEEHGATHAGRTARTWARAAHIVSCVQYLSFLETNVNTGIACSKPVVQAKYLRVFNALKICHIHTHKNGVLYSAYFLFHTCSKDVAVVEPHTYFDLYTSIMLSSLIISMLKREMKTVEDICKQNDSDTVAGNIPRILVEQLLFMSMR